MRIKCKSIGLPLVGATEVYCDNQDVVMNTSIPGSTLSKKHNSINYHIIRESAAEKNFTIGKGRHRNKYFRLLDEIATIQSQNISHSLDLVGLLNM